MRNQPLPGLKKCDACGRLKAQCGCNYASPLKHGPYSNPNDPSAPHGHDNWKGNKNKKDKKDK